MAWTETVLLQGHATNNSARSVFQIQDCYNTQVFVEIGSWSYSRTIQSKESFDDVVVPDTPASLPSKAFFSCCKWNSRDKKFGLAPCLLVPSGAVAQSWRLDPGSV